MPYTKKEDRKKWEGVISDVDTLLKDSKAKEGELNYLITSILKLVYSTNPSYAQFNNAIGLLECIKQEFYRRDVASYENTKIDENGDL